MRGISRVVTLVLALLVVASACRTSDPSATAPSPSATSSATSPPATGSDGSSGPGSTTRGSRPLPNDTTRPPGTALDDEPVGEIGWNRCGQLECGTLTVPVDAAAPEGDTIDLAVVRSPATGERTGTIFVNPGGPGVSGNDYLRFAPLDPALNESFDVVSWDPRGVGDSAPLRCDTKTDEFRATDLGPDDDAEQQALEDAARAVADDCAEKAGDLLEHVNTDDTVRDLERLRRALGVRKLNYIGFSYGTHIGLRYAELFPENIRTMVLDGVVDPTDDLSELLAGQTEALERQVDALFACEVRCPIEDPGAAYDALAEQVEREPIPAGRGESLGPTELAFAVLSASYDPSSQAALLTALRDATRGDAEALLGLADAYWDVAPFSSYLGVVCTDTPHPIGAEAHRELADRLQQISPRFGEFVANEVAPCAHWAAPAVVPTDPVTAEGSAPILVIGNTGDVATPYESAKNVAATLDNGVLLTYEGEGHTSIGRSACVDAAVLAYVTNLTIPQEDC